ncbi:MAG: cyanophycin synthetase [Candidatus Kaiserbacteria bacterium]|nr:MAG: cyanophycin synthetase [Candidatus Kaiserbacteria bacterium]
MQKESLLLGKLLKKIAPQVGARVLLEPTWGVAGQIIFRNGRKSYFRYNTLDLNRVGSSDIAKDKDYAAFFMRRMGYRAIEGKTFFRDDFAKILRSKRSGKAAAAYAKKIGYPLVVKPNSGSHGTGVLVVRSDRELKAALKHVFANDRVALVQRLARGRDYRIVVLDTNVISAYERIPLSVVGDGRSTIGQLLRKKARAFLAASRDTNIQLDDARMKAKLRAQKRSMRSVPARGERIFLLDNANLSSGGDAVDVTQSIHPGWKRLAIRLTKDMGLRLCGVDIMTEGGIEQTPHRYVVLEINAAPGLDHYVKAGKAQEKIVENLYLKVLKSLSRS